MVLMDEPLGTLDKQLREQLQLEIRRIQRALGTTAVYVTHDQQEALTTMSDRGGSCVCVPLLGLVAARPRPAAS